MIITIISAILILLGVVFFFGAALGIVRFPDFYSRTHAAGKGDTLSSFLVILGFAVYQLKDFHSFSHDWPILLVILKLLAVSLFIFMTSPVSTHALMDAGWEDKVKPEIGEGKPNHLNDDSEKF
ncbi:MAG: monovalent cation/H(+) antiporter subunit G [Verrucomicrobiales bacterium]|jgi:multicomponent Na+:H+ antiporter subunit G|nr:monovalent cation/H(+) antiporter subunit G [Verrucomicrobiales bacterium]